MYTDAFNDAPFTIAIFILVEITPKPRIDVVNAIVGTKYISDVVDLARGGGSVHFNGMVHDAVHGAREALVRVDYTVTKRHCVSHEYPVVVGGFWPVRRFHEVAIEAVNTACVPGSNLSNSVVVGKCCAHVPPQESPHFSGRHSVNTSDEEYETQSAHPLSCCTSGGRYRLRINGIFYDHQHFALYNCADRCFFHHKHGASCIG